MRASSTHVIAIFLRSNDKSSNYCYSKINCLYSNVFIPKVSFEYVEYKRVYKHFYNVGNFRAHKLLTKFGLYLVMQWSESREMHAYRVFWPCRVHSSYSLGSSNNVLPVCPHATMVPIQNDTCSQ